MPTRRRSQSAWPQSARCLYVAEQQRCRRVATVENTFCRQHAELVAYQSVTGEQIASMVNKIATGQAQNPFTIIVGALKGYVSGLMSIQSSGSPSPSSSRGSPGSRSQRSASPPRPSPAPPPPPDPLLRAREVLGFEPTEPLTRDKVRRRKQALARVFHPDMSEGSKLQMQRVNQAADLLLAKLP